MASLNIQHEFLVSSTAAKAFGRAVAAAGGRFQVTASLLDAEWTEPAPVELADALEVLVGNARALGVAFRLSLR